MPPHKGCKSRLVTAANIILQELPIGQPRTVTQKHRPAKVLDDLTHLARRHVVFLVGAKVALYITTTRRRRFDTLFGVYADVWDAGLGYEGTHFTFADREAFVVCHKGDASHFLSSILKK
jgi:hypothetical protein